MAADSIQPVTPPFHGVDRAGNHGQKKKEQPPFSLEEQEKGKEKEKPAAEESPPAEDLEVAPPKEGEAGNQLNVIV